MSYAKRVRDAEKMVENALYDLKCSNPTLIIDKKNRIVFANKINKNQVCLLSGGGSGHEPFSIGFVGDGLLTAAIVGSACEPPAATAILSAIRILAKQNENSGVLAITMNYPTDIANFGLAVEEAKSEYINVEMVVINEDYFQPTQSDLLDSGQSGMCGNCFIFKIAGNMAKVGEKLSTILDQSYIINNSTCTVGAIEAYRSLPGIGPLFRINVDDMDSSAIIECERMYRTKIRSVNELIDTMISKIIAILGISHDDEVCVAVHKFGSVSHLELGAICNKIYNFLTDLDIVTCRMYHGSLDTSVELTGFQISILNVTENPEWLEHLDASTNVSIWPSPCVSIPISIRDSSRIRSNRPPIIHKVGPKFTTEEAMLFEKCLRSTANVVLRKGNKVTELDNLSKDGDAGSTLRRIAERLLQDMPKLDLEYPAMCFAHLSKISQTIGGSSGILYSTLMTSCSRFIITASNIDWVQMWRTSLDSFLGYSKAKIGERTMFMKNLREILLRPMYTQIRRNSQSLRHLKMQ